MAPAAEGGANGGGPNSPGVLVVDDEPSVLDISGRMLKKLGFEVLEACSGRDAIRVFRENLAKIDLVLLDMIMPDLGGGEVYDHMRDIHPGVKAILATGYSIDRPKTSRSPKPPPVHRRSSPSGPRTEKPVKMPPATARTAIRRTTGPAARRIHFSIKDVEIWRSITPHRNAWP